MAPPTMHTAETLASSVGGDTVAVRERPVVPEVSVCIVSWNRRDLLDRCLESLFRQWQGTSFEVVVVDNASTDGAADLVAQRYPEAHLIRNQVNLGFARANNQAARIARGRCLLFLNNDTEVRPHTLRRLVEALAENPAAVAVGPRMRSPAGDLQVTHRRRPTLGAFLHRTWLLRWTGLFRRAHREFRRGDPASGGARSVDVLLGAALLIDRRRFFALGAWNETFFFGGEDLEFCARARAVGVLLHLADVEIIHHGRASTKANIGPATIAIAEGFVRYFRLQGTSRAGLLFYKTMLTLDAPLQLLVKAGQCLWRTVRGQKDKRAKCWNDLKGIAAFLFLGLGRFWRA